MFVTFEGIDGSGKSTQAHLLADALRSDGGELLLTREPGGTPLGEQIRSLVLHGDHVAPWAEAALYTASRAQHVVDVIRPALARGDTVICDRYLDSSAAYQGAGRGLGLDAVYALNVTAVGGLLPDHTVLLEIDVETAIARIGTQPDRIERDGIGLLERVAAAYRELAQRFPGRYVVIDGHRSQDEIAREIREFLR